jgi:hypothetical protein
MRFPNLILLMRHTHVLQRDLAPILKHSDGYLNDRLNGRFDFAPHEKTRIAERLGVTDVAWLFAPYQPPLVTRRENAMLNPATETR